jgi:thioester reductase-like protein
MDSIIDYLEHWAAVQPGWRLSAFLDVDGHETESYTYWDFHQRTRYLAEQLSKRFGVKKGARVLLVYPPGLEVSVAFFACARIGAIPVPVCPPTPLGFARNFAKLAFIACDSQASIALTTNAFYASYQRLRGECRIPSSSRNASQMPRVEWIATDALRGLPSESFRNDPGPVLFLQYTSGSTNDPKGVVVSHANVIHNGRNTVDHTAVGVSWLPHYHDMGLIGYHLYPVVTGATVYSFSPLDFLKRPLLWLQTMGRVRATYASSPNFGFEYCLREDKVPTAQLNGLDLSSMLVLMNASESVHPDTCLRFRERFALYGLAPEAVVAAYGLAENTLTATHYGRHSIAVNKRLLQQNTLQIVEARSMDPTQIRLASCGKALEGIRLQIVNPESGAVLGPNEIGEIWLAGKSTCWGYWNKQELTRETFGNTIKGHPEDANAYLRTGDLGFLYEDELFVCGRIKDLIVINGVNYYPQDIEFIVESSSQKIRSGGVAAFNGDQERDTLIIIAEVRIAKDLPDPYEIVRAIRTQCYVEPYAIIFATSGTIVRTTSGKIARSLTRLRLLGGVLQTIATHLVTRPKEPTENAGPRARFLHILDSYNLTGQETCTFAEVGIDSLTLAALLSEIEQLFKAHCAINLAIQLDVWLIQRLTIADFFSLLDQVETVPAGGEAALESFLQQLKQDCEAQERALMRLDAHLKTTDCVEVCERGEPVANVLLTGPTGFFGPFLLNSLLKHTPYTYYALTRAMNPVDGMNRIRAFLRGAGLWTPFLDEELNTRVHVVCGDIAQPNLGLGLEQWQSLAACVQAVLHNAALVNYVLSYEALRAHNVDGTRELLRFSHTGIPKEFHFISSTVIFGWTQSAEVLESDNNEAMLNLDFGYAQSKWVAEQLVFAAARQGLDITIYRPAFLSPSTGGVGSRNDIALLLLAFMIKHGIAVNALNQISFLPVDIAAAGIAAMFHQRNPAHTTLHVTADSYYNMVDITHLITENYGYPFVYYEITDFVAELNSHCTKEDPLYPLLPFINRSHQKMAGMQHKRYNNEQYRETRKRLQGIDEPALKDVVSYLMAYLFAEELIPGCPEPKD